MPYSPHPPQSGTPRRNHSVDTAAHHLGWAAHELDLVSNALVGRVFLIEADIAEAQNRIAAAQATIAKVSAELNSLASGLRVPGASNEHPAVQGGFRS